ncbi:hypothetical protein FMEXI_4684 [Fusarium mexicanum]|uniref:Uncharacterized protein n=1 Tax=Fusarium mexicanum TaxID=751941 RepID=A0A8H5J5N5_9HYPO|nr:hypothetical protein FMEXI_4684 [Fusarium mexicanum]
MKFSTIFLTLASVATAMAVALPEPEVEIPGKLVSRDEFELAIRQAGDSSIYGSGPSASFRSPKLERDMGSLLSLLPSVDGEDVTVTVLLVAAVVAVVEPVSLMVEVSCADSVVFDAPSWEIGAKVSARASLGHSM